MNGLNVFLTFNLTRCFCLHDWHHEHGLHFCFFLSHCGHVFGIKHPKRERETRFSRQVALKELLLSGLPSKKKNPQAAMLDLSICSQSSSGGPDCVVTSSRKCAWFLDLSNITQILGAPGASLLNFSF